MEIASNLQLQMYDLTERDLEKSIFDFSAENRTQLPQLPYATNEFDLALCTDYIFYHQLSSSEMMAVIS